MPRKLVKKSARRRRIVRRRKSSAKTITIRSSGMQMFPDRYVAIGRTSYGENINVTGAAGTNQKVYTMQFCNRITGATQYFSNTSSTASNYPSGLAYLLGDPNKASAGAGGNAPYYKYRVHNTKVRLTVVPVPVATNAPLIVIIFPIIGSTDSLFTGMTLSQVREQPYSKVRILPAYDATQPITMTFSLSPYRIFGEKYKATIENGNFDGLYDTPPNAASDHTIVMWFGTMHSSTIDYSLNFHYDVQVEQRIEFFERNQFITSAPA